jgi:hypothetical protein
MSSDLLHKINIGSLETGDNFLLPESLKESLQLISDFFNENVNHKLCLVFPTKEYVAQWLSIPTVLNMIQSDYAQFQNAITESLEQNKKGDRILINNDAVVEWVGRTPIGFVFKHKEYKGEDKITIDIKKISKIQPAPPNLKALSSYKRVIEALNLTNENPTDKILGIQTDGNRVFQRHSVCLISKHISFENVISEISLNNLHIDEYFKKGKIDDAGEIDFKSPLLISNNLTNLALYLTLCDTISTIIIDGFSSIMDRSIDFNDIDVKRIPTILITDLSEIDCFETIGSYGFDFYNFNKENLKLGKIKKLSPFNLFEKKLHKFAAFNIAKEICISSELEAISKLIHSIENDESVRELVSINISLIQVTNILSRIVHPLNSRELSAYSEMIEKVEKLCSESRFFLGKALNTIETSIMLIKKLIDKLSTEPSQKCLRLKELMLKNNYDYIICSTEEETVSLSRYLESQNLKRKSNVISVADVNDNLLNKETTKAILTGWIKSKNLNKILSSFIFSELTVLFYQFEFRYFNSLQNRNKKYSDLVCSTIDIKGKRVRDSFTQPDAFSHVFETQSKIDADTNQNFDVVDFEKNMENAQYSKYIVKGNINESVKSKRVEFSGNKFIYLTETHGLLVLENYDNTSNKTTKITKNRIENLHIGDVIAFLKTEREVLNDIVEKQTTQEELAETLKWIHLWKNSLREYYLSLNRDFNKLVRDLREKHCSREAATIRSWLFDELRIGPRKDDDLISIALVSNNNELLENIHNVRSAIRQMTSWRMKASDFVIEQIKNKVKFSATKMKVNSVMDFEDLGEIEILEIIEISTTYDNVDTRNTNRLIEKSNL